MQSSSITLHVDGMMCMKNCGSSVQRALLTVPGVAAADVNADDLRTVVVQADGTVDGSALVAAVEAIGFDAVVTDAGASPGDTGVVTVLDVDGMMCMKNCGSSVQRALLATSGVSQVDVDATSLRQVQVHHSAAVSVATLCSAVEAIGFGCAAADRSAGSDAGTVHTTLHVDGMMCMKNCGSSVQRALLAVPGVAAADVNADDLRTVVVQADGTVDGSALVAAVEAIGFDAVVADAGAAAASSAARTVVPGAQSAGAAAAASGRLLAAMRTQSAAATGGAFSLHITTHEDLDSASARRLEAAFLHAADGAAPVIVSHATVSQARNSAEVDGKIAAASQSIRDSKAQIVAWGRARVVAAGLRPLKASATLQQPEDAPLDAVCLDIGDSGHGDKTVKLQVSGMSCAACSGKVEKGLLAIPGVVSASVAVATNSAVVSYASSKLPGVRVLTDTCDELGYPARVVTGGSRDSAASLLKNAQEDVRSWKQLFLVCVALMGTMLLLEWVLPHVPPLGNWLLAEVPGAHGVPCKHIIMAVLAAPVQFWVGRRFYVATWRGIRAGWQLGMDALVVVGTSSAYLYSIVALLAQCFGAMGDDASWMHLFFATPINLFTFVVGGKFLEALAKGRTTSAVQALLQLQPNEALLLPAQHCAASMSHAEISKAVRAVSAEEVCKGDVLLVPPATRVPVDCTVLQGESSVSEAALTGESMPVDKASGSTLIGGTENLSSWLLVRAVSPVEGSALAQIISIVEAAQSRKAPIQDGADRIAGIFAPVILSLGLLVFLLWCGLLYSGVVPASSLPHHTPAIVVSFTMAISVVVVACPCALGLATPTAVMVATGRGAHLGVLIKGGDRLQAAAGVTDVVFDKTGTLTQGRASVTQAFCLSDVDAASTWGAAAVARHALAAESGSNHPAAVAIQQHCSSTLGEDVPVAGESGTAVAGSGMRCTFEGSSVFVGKLPPAVRDQHRQAQMQEDDEQATTPNLVDSMPLLSGAAASGASSPPEQAAEELPLSAAKYHPALLQQLQAEAAAGKTVSGVFVDDVLVGGFALQDGIRDSAAPTVRWLRQQGVRVWMLTGDNSAAAEKVALQCGIDPSNVKANVLPSGKSSAVSAIQRELCGGARRVVAMVGDGINDAPALATADVGIALGAGTSVAVDAADIVLLADDVAGVATALALAGSALRRIRLNLLLSVAYNVLAVPIAAGALFPIMHTILPPETAALAMALSSVSVVLSSLALNYFKPPLAPAAGGARPAAQRSGGCLVACSTSHCLVRCGAPPSGYEMV